MSLDLYWRAGTHKVRRWARALRPGPRRTPSPNPRHDIRHQTASAATGCVERALQRSACCGEGRPGHISTPSAAGLFTGYLCRVEVVVVCAVVLHALVPQHLDVLRMRDWYSHQSLRCGQVKRATAAVGTREGLWLMGGATTPTTAPPGRLFFQPQSARKVDMKFHIAASCTCLYSHVNALQHRVLRRGQEVLGGRAELFRLHSQRGQLCKVVC